MAFTIIRACEMFYDNFPSHKFIKLISSPKGEGFLPERDIKTTDNWVIPIRSWHIINS